MTEESLEAALRETQAQLAQTRCELDAARQELANARADALRMAESEGKRIKKHLSYRIGAAIVGTHSVRDIVRLPSRLLAAYRESRIQNDPLRLLTKLYGAFGTLAHYDNQTSTALATLDEASHEQYIRALVRARLFRECAGAFEHRYGLAPVAITPSIRTTVFRAYVQSLLRTGRADEAERYVRELVQTWPNELIYSLVLGYILVDHASAEARDHLRAAVAGGSLEITALMLLYRSLLVEELPLSHINADIVRFAGGESQSAQDNLPFVRASICQQEGRGNDALAEINAYLRHIRLAPLACAQPALGFGMDNLQSAAAIRPVNDGLLVSVLMTTFNSADYLRTAVDSVLKQSYRNLELIIVDDCSTDNTQELLAALAASNPRVRVLHNQRNAGTYCAKNLGLHAARGALITCHDSDDWSHPEKIARQVEALQRSKALACVSNWARIDERGIFEAKRWGNIIHSNPSSLLYRKAVVEKIGYYDSVRTGGDSEFEHRIRHVFGMSAIHEMRECLSFGRVRSDSLTQMGVLGFDEFGASPKRQAYWQAWGAWHRKALRDPAVQLHIDFPQQTGRPFVAPDEIIVDHAVTQDNIQALRN